MFPRNKVTGVVGNSIRTASTQPQIIAGHAARQAPKTEVTASLGGMGGFGASNSLSVMTSWNSQYQYYMTGILPADPSFADSSQLALFYRDIYHFDNVAGSAVDIQSTFPFSDFDLRGLDEKELDVYKEATDQLNILRMLPMVSTAYLTDGYFAGSLVFDGGSKRFLDILMHSALSCQVLPTQFFNMMPTINVQTNMATAQLLGSDNPYAKEYMSNLPAAFLDMLKQGTFRLNPVSTLFVARRSLTDRAYISYLHRILPYYLIEKTLFRGTLTEVQRRQRAMTHLTAGDDVWTPTGEELQALVAQFQQAEMDPLGGWVSTRNAINATDLRPGGDFLKFTDIADILVPYKLRALGLSEAFLSQDANFSTAESAYSTFLETSNAYRSHLTHSVFDSTLFPLIAIANGFYKEGAAKVNRGQVSQYLMHAHNRSNLKMPQLIWHKSLEAKGEDNTFDLLDKASEKGVPVPLKAWMAAAGMDSETLLKDLKDDIDLRAKLEKYTGKDTSHEGEDRGEDDYSLEASAVTTQSVKGGGRNRRALLSRDWGEPEVYATTKTGKKTMVHNWRAKQRDHNAMIAKIAARAEVDPEYRMKLAKANVEKFGSATIPGMADLPRR